MSFFAFQNSMHSSDHLKEMFLRVGVLNSIFLRWCLSLFIATVELCCKVNRVVDHVLHSTDFPHRVFVITHSSLLQPSVFEILPPLRSCSFSFGPRRWYYCKVTDCFFSLSVACIITRRRCMCVLQSGSHDRHSMGWPQWPAADTDDWSWCRDKCLRTAERTGPLKRSQVEN